MGEIRQCYDPLIATMGFLYVVRWLLYIDDLSIFLVGFSMLGGSILPGVTPLDFKSLTSTDLCPQHDEGSLLDFHSSFQ